MKKAFTLIEVMVVLSILAIIAILAYNFFGNTMKDASVEKCKVEVIRKAEAMASAVIEYERRTGTELNSILSEALFEDVFVDTGILKSIDARNITDACRIPEGTSFFEYRKGGYNIGNTAALDNYIQINSVTLDVCHALHKAGTGRATAWDYDVEGDHVADAQFFCEYWADGGMTGGSDTWFVLPITKF